LLQPATGLLVDVACRYGFESASTVPFQTAPDLLGPSCLYGSIVVETGQQALRQSRALRPWKAECGRFQLIQK
jgi:hypothetical protein